jgi:hypothetical protein
VVLTATVLPALHTVAGWLPQGVDEDGDRIDPSVAVAFFSLIFSVLVYWWLISRLRKDAKQIRDLRTAIQIVACDQHVDWQSVPDLDTYRESRNLPLAMALETAGIIRPKLELDERERVIASWRAQLDEPDHVRAVKEALEHGPYSGMYWSFQIVSSEFRKLIHRETRERFPRECYFAELHILIAYRASVFRKVAFAEMAKDVGNPCLATLIHAIAEMVDKPGNPKEIEESTRRELNEAFAREIELELLEDEIKNYVKLHLEEAVVRWLARYKDDAGTVAIFDRWKRLRDGVSKMAEYLGQARGFATERHDMEMNLKIDRYEWLKNMQVGNGARPRSITWEMYEAANRGLAAFAKSEAALPVDEPNKPTLPQEQD